MTAAGPELSPVRVPDIGASVPSVRVGSWLADPGDHLIAGDRVVEITFPGMTVDVAAPVDGVLVEQRHAANDVVRPSDVLGWMRPAKAN